MPPARNRRGLDGFSSAGADRGQPPFGLLCEHRGWRGVLVERGRVVYTLLLDVITETPARYRLGCTNPERNGAALSLGTRHVYPVATVARHCFGPLTGMCWLIHVT